MPVAADADPVDAQNEQNPRRGDALAMSADRLTVMICAFNAFGCLAIVGLTMLQRPRHRAPADDEFRFTPA